MSLPTSEAEPIVSLGVEGGSDLVSSGAAVFPFSTLDSAIYAERRWCANCGGEQNFIPVYELEHGRWGYCAGCEEQKCVPFTRTVGEVA